MSTRKALILLAGAIVVTLGALAGREHVWIRASTSEITANGLTLPGELWRSPTGWFFVRSSHGDYVISPERRFVGIPNGGELWPFGFAALTKHGPVLAVRMPSAKVPRDPELAVDKTAIAFIAADGARLMFRRRPAG